MSAWLLTVSALDAAGAAKTLYFSDSGYVDAEANFYEPRLLQPALIDVSPNDGGTFTLFESSSIGDVELANVDGSLDYLVDYAVDGRTAVLSLVDDNGSVSTVLSGTIGRMSERKGSLFLTYKALMETLDDEHRLDVYAGTNTGSTGLEGTTDTIAGDVKPKILGDCRNVTPVLVNESLLIYQVSSRNDAVITAVYDDGVRLTNYLTNGARAVGDTSIAIDSGVGAVPAGSKVVFYNHTTIYTVATGLSGGVIILSSGLTVAIDDNKPVEIVNSYTGSGSAVGELQNSITSSAWSSFNGYFRLASTPNKLVTCDVMSVTNGALHKAGDVFAALAGELNITVDSASITELNTAGIIGIDVTDPTPSRELFDKIARSVGGYYHFIGSTLYLNLFQAPSSTALFTLEDWQISSLEREATGLGDNGLPIYAVDIKYARLATVQATVAGSVSKSRAAYISKGFKAHKIPDATVKTRHPLSKRLSIDSALFDATAAWTVGARLLAIAKVRRDVITLTAHFSQIPAFNIGDTIKIKHPRYGYSSGRNMVIAGFERDIRKKRVQLRCYG